MRRLRGFILGLTILVVVLATGWWWAERRIDHVLHPAPETIVSASLEGLREQNRLSAFVASYVAVVTSTQSRFGLSASKTLIMPGLVRYEVDLGRLDRTDVRWDAAAHRLDIVLPPIDVVGPQVDLTRIKEYGSGGLLIRLTDTEHSLDDSNRRAGQAELLRQARAPVPMQLARDATRRAVQRSFALPLRAAGLDAGVRVRFSDESGFPPNDDRPMDRSRSLDEVYRKMP